ncbi:MAG: glycosyltransferase [PVC group bacterium]|nr:glycosyltransferase [PVC group bacterium]
MSNPLISVLMPAYNAKQYIKEAIESIINQTFKDFEFIIIDDNSKDNTWDIIQEYAHKDSRIVALKNDENLKLSKTLNKGLAQAKGKYIARMDADDISVPDRFQKQINYMERYPEVGILGGAMELRDINDKFIGIRKYSVMDEKIKKYIYRYCPFCHPAIMLKKDVLNQVGGYNEQWNPAEDYDLYFRIGKITKFANLKDILIKYRVVPQSMTTGLTNEMYLKTIKIRLKYAKDKDYKMSLFDRMYTMLQFAAIYILPTKVKIWIFHILRDSK